MDLATTVDAVFEGYKAFSVAHPLLCSIATAEATFVAGDCISQLIKDKTVDPRKVRYTATLAPLYGLGTHALVQTGELVGEYISDHPLAKSALGPNNIHGILYNTFFFVNNTVGERTGYSLTELAKHYACIFSGTGSLWQRFKDKYIANVPGKEFAYTTATVVTAWNAIQYVNYAHVPEELRTAFVLAANIAWVTALSLWSLTGRRRIVKPT